MKKYIALALAALTFAGSARAFDGEPEEGLSYQAFIGLNVSSIQNTELGAKTGMTLGARAQYFLPKAHGTYIAAGLDWTWKGAKNTTVHNYINDEVNTYLFQHGSGKSVPANENSKMLQQMHYIELPIHVGFHYNLNSKLGFFGELGPYFAFALAGGSRYEYSTDDADIRNAASSQNWDTFNNSSPEPANYGDANEFRPQYQRWDAGIGFAVGAEYNKHYSLNFGFNWGLADLYREGFREGHYKYTENKTGVGQSLPKAKNFCFTLAFAYRF